jgi:hypothetical protein
MRSLQEEKTYQVKETPEALHLRALGSVHVLHDEVAASRNLPGAHTQFPELRRNPSALHSKEKRG